MKSSAARDIGLPIFFNRGWKSAQCVPHRIYPYVAAKRISSQRVNIETTCAQHSNKKYTRTRRGRTNIRRPNHNRLVQLVIFMQRCEHAVQNLPISIVQDSNNILRNKKTWAGSDYEPNEMAEEIVSTVAGISLADNTKTLARRPTNDPIQLPVLKPRSMKKAIGVQSRDVLIQVGDARKVAGVGSSRARVKLDR